MGRERILEPHGKSCSDLSYSEHSGSGGGIHLLIQPRQLKQIPFASEIYRLVVESYLSPDRILPPDKFLAQLLVEMERGAERCSLSTDDLRSLGFYLLLEEPGFIYLLCSLDGKAGVDRGGGIEPVQEGAEIWPIELLGRESQGELFPHRVAALFTVYRLCPPHRSSWTIVAGCSPRQWELVSGSRRARVDDDRPLAELTGKILLVETVGSTGAEQGQGELASQAGRSHHLLLAVLLSSAALVIVAYLAVRVLDRRSVPTGTMVASTQGPAPTALTPVHRTPAPKQVTLSLLWKKTYSQPVTSSPRCWEDLVIFGCRDRCLYALSSETGEQRWKYKASAGVGASPLVVEDKVIGADYSGDVFCLDSAAGTPLWHRLLGSKVVSSPIMTSAGVVVGAFDRSIYCLSPDDGAVRWKRSTRGVIWSTAAAWGRLVFVPSQDGNVYGIDAQNGAVLWSRTLGGALSSSPVAAAGKVVVGTPAGVVYAFEGASGKVLWKLDAGAPIKSRLALAGGRIYLGTNSGSLYCVDAATGEVRWKVGADGPILGKPVCWDRFVLVGSYDGRFYAWDRENGRVVASFSTGRSIYSSPCISGDRVYFGDNGGGFYCLSMVAPNS